MQAIIVANPSCFSANEATGQLTNEVLTLVECLTLRIKRLLLPHFSFYVAAMEHFSGSTDPAVASLDSSARVLLTTVTHKLLPALNSVKAGVDQDGNAANVNWGDALVRHQTNKIALTILILRQYTFTY